MEAAPDRIREVRMDEQRYNYYEDDVEIDLIDLMFHLLKKWRGLIVAIVLGAVLGMGIYAVKAHQQKKELAANAATAEEMQKEDTFDESQYDIDDDVKANMELAYQYRQLYRRQLEYNQKSIIMKLDPNAVYTGDLKYYLTAGYDTGLVSVLYQSILSDKNLLTELQAASGLDCDVPYIKELIDSGVSTENDSNININNLVSDLTDSMASVTKNAIISYKVVSTSEESCEKMIQVIREKVQELDAQCQENYAGYSAVEVADSVRKVTDNSYLNLQKTNIDQLNTYLTNVQRLENALSDTEKEYYCKKYLAREYKAENEEDTANTVVTLEAEPVSKVKWLLVGMILCICLWGAYECCRYLFDGSVKTASEAQTLTHLPVLGCYQHQTSERKGLDRLLDCLQAKMGRKGDSLSYMKAVITSMEEAAIVLSVESGLTETRKIMDEFASMCQNLKCSDYTCENEDALAMAKNVGNEILVVSTGKTRKINLERELEVCRLQGINITGFIIVENL